MHSSINIIAAVGLALGGVLGLVGAMVTQQNVQAILWAIDGAGLVMATPLLAIKYFRTGNDIVAGGFLVFAIGEGIILWAQRRVLRVASRHLPLAPPRMVVDVERLLRSLPTKKTLLP
jgi:hypothetical protein